MKKKILSAAVALGLAFMCCVDVEAKDTHSDMLVEKYNSGDAEAMVYMIGVVNGASTAYNFQLLNTKGDDGNACVLDNEDITFILKTSVRRYTEGTNPISLLLTLVARTDGVCHYMTGFSITGLDED